MNTEPEESEEGEPSIAIIYDPDTGEETEIEYTMR